MTTEEIQQATDEVRERLGLRGEVKLEVKTAGEIFALMGDVHAMGGYYNPSWHQRGRHWLIMREGIPAELTRYVIAHELFHAAQAERFEDFQSYRDWSDAPVGSEMLPWLKNRGEREAWPTAAYIANELWGDPLRTEWDLLELMADFYEELDPNDPHIAAIRRRIARYRKEGQ